MRNGKEENLAPSKVKNPFRWMFGLIAIVSVVMVWFYVCKFRNLSISPEGFGQFGDYIGGILNPIVACFSLYALYKITLFQHETQEKALNEERERADRAVQREDALREQDEIRQMKEHFFLEYEAYLRMLDRIFAVLPTREGVTRDQVDFRWAILAEYKHLKAKGLFVSTVGDDGLSNAIKFLFDNGASPIKLVEQDQIDYDFIARLYNRNENTVNDIVQRFSPLKSYFRFVLHILQLDKLKTKQSLDKQKAMREHIDFFKMQLSTEELSLIALYVLYVAEDNHPLQALHQVSFFDFLPNNTVLSLLLEKKIKELNQKDTL